jgi:hypothetical protein
VGVGLAAELLHGRGAGEDTDYGAETGVGPGLHRSLPQARLFSPEGRDCDISLIYRELITS